MTGRRFIKNKLARRLDAKQCLPMGQVLEKGDRGKTAPDLWLTNHSTHDLKRQPIRST